MSRGIRLSKKHGANPTIAICAWCNEPTGEVVLVGQLPGDAEAPKEMIVSYEPCDKCREKWEQGVACIEVDTVPVNATQPPIRDNLYPTGRVVVAQSDRLSEILEREFNNGERAIVDVGAFQQIFGHIFSNGGNLQ